MQAFQEHFTTIVNENILGKQCTMENWKVREYRPFAFAFTFRVHGQTPAAVQERSPQPLSLGRIVDWNRTESG